MSKAWWEDPSRLVGSASLCCLKKYARGGGCSLTVRGRPSPVDVFAWRSVGLVAEVFQGRPYQASSSSTAVVTAAAQNERAIVREKLRRAVDKRFLLVVVEMIRTART